MTKPEKIKIVAEPEEDSRFHFVGKLPDGRQFMAFVTGAFPEEQPFGPPEVHRWYAVLHLFDDDGNHVSTRVANGGTDAEGRDKACARAITQLEEMLQALGGGKLCNIQVRLFEHQEDGYRFGLIYNSEEDDESVMLEPNDIMFHAPYDARYST